MERSFDGHFCEEDELLLNSWTISRWNSTCIGAKLKTNVVIVDQPVYFSKGEFGRISIAKLCSVSLPSFINWPCEWVKGKIPYTFNLYSLNKIRLVTLVKKALKFLEDHSCLKFVEQNPLVVARNNLTHIAFTYSEVLESCCFRLYTRPVRRRNVLVTPLCSMSVEIAHAVLHAMGMSHRKDQPFNKKNAERVLFLKKCYKKGLIPYRIKKG